ncbi:MAG: prolyl oligopeptidase family serine peptidase [Alphaproteobacteria bacterium]|nr:prolyl oligopeptidase family serine peptidase [Alphaproteobacteria bacterium]
MWKTCSFAVLLALLLPVGARAADLLPVEDFASIPKIGGPSDTTDIELSPDGAHYATIVSVHGVPALASFATDGSHDIKMVNYGDYQPRRIDWADDTHILASFAFPYRRYGVETTETRLAVFDITSGKLDSLVHYRPPSPRDPAKNVAQFQDEIVSRLPVSDGKVLLALDEDTPGLPGVFSFPLDGGGTGTRVLRERGGIQQWLQDAAGVIRLGYGLRRQSSGYLKFEARLIFRKSADDDFSTEATFDPRDIDGDAFDVVGFTEEPGIILIRDINEQGRLAIYKFDVTSSKVVGTLFSNPKYDVGSVEYAPGTDRAVGVHYIADAPVAVYFDDADKEDYEALGRIYPGKQSWVVSRNSARTKLISRTESPSSPPTYHYFDMTKNVYASLGSAYPELAGLTLSETRPITYKARDGLEIDGYLTLPWKADPHNLPLIVNPHGGPGSRDFLRYDYWVQYFVSRGWAVLQMNFRGSTGYGTQLHDAGSHEWGRAMQDDITDGVNWAVSQGVADPARICIVGASYGGYAALEGAASTPDLYACAVSLNGVSDIGAMISSDRFYDNYMFSRDYFAQDDNKAVSPRYHVDDVKAPILVAYGTDDRVVDPDQSTSMISALKHAGKAVVEVKLKDGDHYLTHESNRIAFFKAMDDFLQEHLGLGQVPVAAPPAGKPE